MNIQINKPGSTLLVETHHKQTSNDGREGFPTAKEHRSSTGLHAEMPGLFNGLVFETLKVMEQIGFGGSCHWCTEAIFQSLKGVATVGQGWIASEDQNSDFSEAVLVTFDPEIISLETLIAVHLHSHSCTAKHTLRNKYRSAIYTFSKSQANAAKQAIQQLQRDFEEPIITQVLPFKTFKLNGAEYLDYYYRDPEKPFCQTYISPKLQLLRERFAGNLKP